MAWQETMVTMVRVLINDLDSSNYTYSNERLEQTILVSAQYVASAADFQNAYVVDLGQFTLIPDPTDDPADNDYINLVCLKAACLILEVLHKLPLVIRYSSKMAPQQLTHERQPVRS